MGSFTRRWRRNAWIIPPPKLFQASTQWRGTALIIMSICVTTQPCWGLRMPLVGGKLDDYPPPGLTNLRPPPTCMHVSRLLPTSPAHSTSPASNTDVKAEFSKDMDGAYGWKLSMLECMYFVWQLLLQLILVIGDAKIP